MQKARHSAAPDGVRNAVIACLAAAIVAGAVADNWTNNGGNGRRNGQSTVAGPTAEDLLWGNTDDFSIISWHPYILDGRVFTIREAGFPQAGGSANDALVAYDIDTGAELWRRTLTFGGDTSQEWIAWIAGVNNSKVYASRSSNTQPQPIRQFDAVSGAVGWESEYHTMAWAHDGVVFAPDGDLIVGDFNSVVRIDASDGGTVWETPRSCPVSGNCGVAINSTAAYIDESAAGGNQLTKIALDTGQVLYSSPVMAGFTDQNSPFLSPDGNTIYFSRTQNNTSVDFLFAFVDTGNQFTQLWMRPVRWTTSHEHGIGLDGSIYTFTQDNEFVRLNPANGNIMDNAGVLSPIGSPNLSAKTAVDAKGNVFVSNGWASSPASDGRMWAFNADLSTNLFTLELDRQNNGGPALGRDGTLIMCDRTGVWAYRSPIDGCVADLTGDGGVGPADLAALLGAWGPGPGNPADLDGDDLVGAADLAILLGHWGQCR